MSDRSKVGYEVRSNKAIVVANYVSDKSEATKSPWGKAKCSRELCERQKQSCSQSSQQQVRKQNAAHEVRSNKAIVVANCVSDKSKAAMKFAATSSRPLLSEATKFLWGISEM